MVRQKSAAGVLSALFLLASACGSDSEIAVSSTSTIGRETSTSAKPENSRIDQQESNSSLRGERVSSSSTTSSPTKTTAPSSASIPKQAEIEKSDSEPNAEKSGDSVLPDGSRFMDVSFDDLPSGNFDEQAVKEAFPGVAWANIASKTEVKEENGDSYLRVHYPQGSVGPGEGGAQWKIDLDDAHEVLYLSYKVRFAEGFDFVRGGKLPGLIGGEGNTGGDKPNGTDGWSARMMWREKGDAVQYVYHPDQPSTWGEDFEWEAGKPLQFIPGEWATVVHRVEMNQPGVSNGSIKGWFNGQLALEETNIRFRDVDSIAIDGFYFSTFFGGNDTTWQASRNEYVDFDDFVITTG